MQQKYHFWSIEYVPIRTLIRCFYFAWPNYSIFTVFHVKRLAIVYPKSLYYAFLSVLSILNIYMFFSAYINVCWNLSNNLYFTNVTKDAVCSVLRFLVSATKSVWALKFELYEGHLKSLNLYLLEYRWPRFNLPMIQSTLKYLLKLSLTL